MREDGIGLTNEQRIQEFQSITAIDDDNFARELLRKHDWNVELAVNDFFSHPNGWRKTSTPNWNDSWFDYFREVTRNSVGDDSIVGGYLAMPLIDLTELFVSGILSITNFVGSIIFPAPHEENNLVSSQLLNPQTQLIYSTQSTQSQLPPWFLTGSHEEAISEARLNSKLLFIVLHDPSSPLSQQFMAETLQNDAVVSFLIHNLICYAMERSSPFAQALLREMPNSSGIYPISSLYKVQKRNIQLLWKYDGFLDADALIAFLMQGMERVQYAQEQVNASNLRAVQDQEYDELIARHQAEQAQSGPEDAPSITPAVQEAESSLEEELEKKRAAFASLIPAEPGPDVSDRMQLRFRLPDGTNITRHFLPSHVICDLRNFVSSLDLQSTDGERVESFELLTPFPRRVYEDDNENLTTAFGSTRRANLVVKELI